MTLPPNTTVTTDSASADAEYARLQRRKKELEKKYGSAEGAFVDAEGNVVGSVTDED